MIASAAQSGIFNAVLQGRSAAGLLYTLREGDLARVRGRPFRCLGERLGDLNLKAAPGALEVSTTGPLPGARCPTPDLEIEREERAWAEAAQIEWSWLEAGGALESRGERRRLIVAPLEPPRLEQDGEATWLCVALPRGSYATELLHQLGISLPLTRGRS